MKIEFIINPRAKNSKIPQLARIIRSRFRSHSINLTPTSYSGEATNLARRAVADGRDIVVAVGGDGTINEVMNGIIGSDLALGIIPTGTANDLATYYGLPRGIYENCDIIRHTRVHRADLIRVNERFYITAGGLGFPSTVAALANTLKNNTRFGNIINQLLSNKIYMICCLFAMLQGSHQNLLRLKSQVQTSTCDVFALIVNNQPLLGGKFMIAPQAVNDDGLFDVCLINNVKSRFEIISIIVKVLIRRHMFSPRVQMWRTNYLKVESKNPSHFLSDGELLPACNTYDIKLYRNALPVIVPATFLHNRARRDMGEIKSP